MNIYEEWKFIASIPKNVKPCFNDKTFVSIDEWFVTFKRRYKGEKAEKGIIYLENLIENTKLFYQNKDEKLLDLLEKSIQGVENLCETYRKDGQYEVSENYEKCIIKIKKIIIGTGTKKKFFSYVPKIINE